MRLIGYARVSTQHQNLNLQIDAINNYATRNGIDEVVIYTEKVSSKKKRPELEQAIKATRKGDLFVTFKPDRVARSLRELLNFVNELKEKGVNFAITDGSIDLTTPQGELQFNMMATFAEFERALISERTKAGLESARKKGRVGGRKPIPTDVRKTVLELHANGTKITTIAKTLDVGRTSIYRILEEEKERV